MHLEDMYINYANALNLPLFFYQKRGKVMEEALLDSRATENFVDYQMVAQWRIGTTKLDKPRKVFNGNGSENKAGTITHCTVLRVKMNGREKLQTFFITDLERDPILLGWPWFLHFNPEIDWTSRTVKGEVELETRWLKWWQRAEQVKEATIPLRQIRIALSQWEKRREGKEREMKTPLLDMNPPPKGRFLPALKKALS